VGESAVTLTGANAELCGELGKGFGRWHILEGDAVALADLDRQLARAPRTDAMMNWMRLEKLRAHPSEALLGAGDASRKHDLTGHLEVLASSASPLELFALAPRSNDPASLVELRGWLRSGSYSMRCLALLRSVREISYPCRRWTSARPGVRLWVKKRLQALAHELGGDDEERALLWWQVWGGLARFDANKVGVTEAIRDVCRDQIVRSSGRKLPPQGERWAEGNGSWESLIAEVATEVAGESRSELVSAFLRAVERRLRGESYQRPDLKSLGGHWTANAFVWTLVEEQGASELWHSLVDEVTDRARPWPRGRRKFADENLLAWLLLVGAAAAGVLSGPRYNAARGRGLAENVLALADAHFGRGWYDAYSLSGALPNLPPNLARAAGCLPLEERERVVLRIGDRLTSTDGLSDFILAVQGMVRHPVLRRLRSMRRDRRAFEERLDGARVHTP